MSSSTKILQQTIVSGIGAHLKDELRAFNLLIIAIEKKLADIRNANAGSIEYANLYVALNDELLKVFEQGHRIADLSQKYCSEHGIELADDNDLQRLISRVIASSAPGYAKLQEMQTQFQSLEKPDAPARKAVLALMEVMTNYLDTKQTGKAVKHGSLLSILQNIYRDLGDNADFLPGKWQGERFICDKKADLNSDKYFSNAQIKNCLVLVHYGLNQSVMKKVSNVRRQSENEEFVTLFYLQTALEGILEIRRLREVKVVQPGLVSDSRRAKSSAKENTDTSQANAKIPSTRNLGKFAQGSSEKTKHDSEGGNTPSKKDMKKNR